MGLSIRSSKPVFILDSEQISKLTRKMMKNIGILMSMLLAFQLNVEAVDFSRCEALSDYHAVGQCRAEVCRYGDDPTACAPFDFMHYGAVASMTGIALMVFIILLIIVVIIKEVNENTSYS